MIPTALVRLKDLSGQLADRLTTGVGQPLATGLFFRSLVVYTVLKLILVWPLSRIVMNHHTVSLPKSFAGKVLMGPSFLANEHVDIFFAGSLALLVLIGVTKRNYVGNVLLFWLTFNLYTVNLPIADGADVVLFMLCFWCIPMTTWPRWTNHQVRPVHHALFNVAIVMCQLQVVYIYLVSGLDKITSVTWRSGLAFEYIRHIEMRFNPLLPAVVENDFWNVVFAWSTMSFELAFVTLVWTKRFRLPLLAIGTIFHLFIGIVLTLPDFALVMIVSYGVFLRDTDLLGIQSWFRRRLPSA